MTGTKVGMDVVSAVQCPTAHPWLFRSLFSNMVSVTSMTISLVSSQQQTTQVVLHLKTRAQMLFHRVQQSPC